jgi:beta-hydroxylase
MFYTTERHESLKVLEDNYAVILDEYRAVSDESVPWPETFLHNGKWRAYGIKFKGSYLPNSCPKTTEIVRSIPNVYIAGFSILKAGCVISPHKGYTDSVWRSHLGLICPDNCWIKVGGVTHEWKEGEVAVFDDTNVHEASNESDRDRVVLIVDIEK